MDKVKACTSLLNSLKILSSNENLLHKLNSLENKVKGNELQLVVLGQFKRGKTTLINALIGENLLPTSIIPLTSIITILKYGKTPRAFVNFLDERIEETQIKNLDEYVSEQKNSENKKQVDKVVIEYPLLYLKEGIQIIDTPGVGSVYKHNTDVAYDFVPKADAGIFVVTADPPISESELDFLVSIKDYLGKIIFVQNKIDQVGEEEVKQSLLFTKNIIEEKVGTKGLKFYPLSSKLALEGRLNKDKNKVNDSNFQEFEKALSDFFKKEKSQVILKSVSVKLLSLINEIDLLLQLQIKTSQIPATTLQEKITLFEKELKAITQKKEDVDYLMQGQTEKLVKETLIDDIETLKEEKQPQLLKELDIFYEKNKSVSGKELSKKFNIFLEQSIKKIFNEWRKKEEDKLQKSLLLILGRFSKEANDAIQKVMDLSANLFDLKIDKFNIGTELAEEFEFRFSFDEYKVDIEIFTPLVSRLPRFLSNKLLYNKIKEDAVQQFDQHCGRVRYDFHERVIKSVQEYKNNLDEILEEIIKNIKDAMKVGIIKKGKSVEEERNRLEFLENEEKIVMKARNLIL